MDEQTVEANKVDALAEALQGAVKRGDEADPWFLAQWLVNHCDRRALLDALGHSPDCVAPDHYRRVWQEERKARERAEARNERLRERSGRAEAALERIANNGCGIPGHAVAVGCGSDQEAAATLAALSADADADAEPSRAEAAWESQNPPPPRGADAEPSPRDAELRDRAEQVAAGGADFCTAWNDEFGLCDRPPDHPGAHERVTGLGATVTWRDPGPSRAEGDEQRVTLDEINRQRERGWLDFHPEDYCHRCGAPNPSWSVDSDRFNAAMGDPGSHGWQGIVCVGCFVRLHEAATGLTCTWKLVPETPFQAAEGGRPREADPQGTPSGNGDASVDDEGDDGRSRVADALDKEMPAASRRECEDAADRLLASGVVRLTDPGEGADGRRRAVDAILATLPDFFREDAEAAVDAALVSGGVASAEYLHEWVDAHWEVCEERDQVEARADRLRRTLESVLRTFWSPQDFIRAALQEDDDA